MIFVCTLFNTDESEIFYFGTYDPANINLFDHFSENTIEYIRIHSVNVYHGGWFDCRNWRKRVYVYIVLKM